MPEHELLRVYDANLECLGEKPRSAVHRDGDWHLTFHGWVVDPNQGGALILQRRGRTHRNYPGLFDVSAAGHYLAGENGLDGMRELEEELGVRASAGQVYHLGVRTSVCITDQLRDFEFQDVYAIVDGRRLSEYRPDPDEVDGVAWVRLADGMALAEGRVASIRVPFLRAFDRQLTEESLALTDIMPSKDKYFLKMLIMASRILDGQSAAV